MKRKNSNQVQKELIEMGFELNMINNLIIYLEIKTTEQAIDYLSKIEEKWNHPIIFSEDIINNGKDINNQIVFDKNSKCAICSDVEENHYTNNLSNIRNLKIKKIDDLILEKKKRDELNKFDTFNFDNIENNLNNSDHLDKEFSNNIVKRDLNSFDEIIELKKKILSSEKIEINIKNEVIKLLNCEICLGEISSEFKLECKHCYCKECLEDYINNKINNSEISKIPCPRGKDKCSYIFKEEIIKTLVNKDNLERYYRFVRRKEIGSMKGLIFCPFPDCESFSILNKNLIKKEFLSDIKNKYLFNNKISSDLVDFNNQNRLIEIKNDLDNNIGICLEFNHSFCLNCKQVSHPGSDCKNIVENEFTKFVNNNNSFVKKCPKCAFFIQKNKGCNHMTCANKECNYEFCWICMRKYNSRHYRNIFSPCFKMQNSDQESIVVKHPFLIYPRMFLIIIGIIVIILLSILLSPIILGFIMAFVSRDRKWITRSFKNGCSRKCFDILTFNMFFFFWNRFISYYVLFLLLDSFTNCMLSLR